jgi:integrase
LALSFAKIDNAKPGPKSKKIFDERGLYIEIAPSGGKYWRFKYRHLGREKRVSLGVFPDVGLADARDRRDEARKLVAAGIDPSEHRKASKAAALARSNNSFEGVAREWMEKFSATWAPGHKDRQLRLLERDLFPLLGRRPVAEISSPELLGVLRKIELRGALDTAHRARGTCGQIFRYGIVTSRCERDPSSDLRGAIARPTQGHFAAITDPVQLAGILRAIDGYQGDLVTRCALRLQPLLFVRPGELRHGEWKDIDFTAAEWRYTVSKTKTEHIVPLAKQAIKILKELQPLTGDGKYLFPSARSPHRVMSDNACLAAMRRMGIKQEEMTGHGWRAAARTILDEQLHFPVHLIEHQLAHAVRDALGRSYNRTQHLPERKKMMARWANYLDRIKAGAAGSAIDRGEASV